ncbi:DUF2157 domain-containing protein [Candidatus Aquarickettsia rohweri]|uniref:DUF2157 domain-containing protein n=1 Tax=Candidatus Aquarickettsia rohweri TaxID=2602574 RepID=A0A3R9YD08_9RICK|nr:DUF2157 domain-containing protein [Candidatus Aquarickettsia rohweri]RST70841.1 DUF2157 domain-containing protein [Candidatus Aquarickettsia rohweri]
MGTEKNNFILQQIPANRKLVEKLYSHGKITKKTREYALNLLYPHDQWILWISRLLLTIGSALILSGIIYFVAFNWSKITPSIKIYSIQFGIISCLIGAYFYSLQHINGKILLLFGSILIGAFMVTFSQIYQTGANSYQLFMMWSLLTFGWTLISNFAAQWIFWLIITNIFFVLWWEQAAQPTREIEFMIFTYMALLNGIALALREYCIITKTCKWLEAKWIRLVLTIVVLLIMLIPIVIWIIYPSIATKSIIFSSIIGFVGHGIAYYFYRYKLPDMWSLTATIISSCFIIECYICKTLVVKPLWESYAFTYMIMGILTLGIFTALITYLRNVLKKLKFDHA